MICDECETVAHCMKNGCVPKTTKKDEALKLALEALESKYIVNCGAWRVQQDQAITALREALAEQPAQPQQEPVFWTRKQWGMDREFCEKPFTTDWEPLYTSPPAHCTWVGLTDEEIDSFRAANSEGRGAGWRFNFKGFARAIEAAHGIKENT